MRTRADRSGRTPRSASLEAWLAAGQRLVLHGHRIFVRTALATGREPLLLIHGYPTSSYDWHHLWQALAERYSVLALDLLGFGASAKPRDERYAIATQADLCEALLDHFDIERPHVLAHDYGDTVAQELLAREREGRRALASVCFLNGGLFPETHRPRRVQTLLAHPVAGPVLARLMNLRSFTRTMRGIAGKTPPADAELRDLWTLTVQDGGRRALARLIDYMAQRRTFRERWVGALIASTVPRRLICGAVDPISGRHLAQRYADLVPRPDIVLLEDVGHYPQLEAPRAVIEHYVEFRTRIGSA